MITLRFQSVSNENHQLELLQIHWLFGFSAAFSILYFYKISYEECLCGNYFYEFINV